MIYARDVVGHLVRIRNQRFGFLQVFERQIVLPAAQIDVAHADVSFSIFRVGIGDDLVLLERGIGLAIVHQVLRQAADGIEIVAILFNRMPVGIDRLLVLFLLFVGVAERRIQASGAGRIRNRAQDFGGARGVALIVIEVGQHGHGLLGIGLQLDRRLKLALGLDEVVVHFIQTAEQKMVIHTVGLDPHHLFVLLDGQLQQVVGTAALLHVAERLQIDPPQQLVRFEIIGVALEDVLRLQNGVAYAAGLDVHLGQRRGQVLRRRIGVDRQPVLVDGLGGHVAAAVPQLLLVHVGQRIVVVSRRAVDFVVCRRAHRTRTRGLRGLLRKQANCQKKHEKGLTNTFHCKPSNSQSHNRFGCRTAGCGCSKYCKPCQGVGTKKPDRDRAWQ